MNIDLSNRWVAFLVGGADLNNGCSVVRGILIRSVFLIIGAVAAAAASVAVAFMIAGVLLMLWAPWYNQFDVHLSLSYLGNSWWAESLRVGAVIGFACLFIMSLVGTVYLFITYAPKYITRGIKRVGRTAALEKVGEAVVVGAGAAMAFGHKFCPRIVFDIIGPDHIKELAKNPGNYMILTAQGLWYEVTKVAPHKHNHRNTRFDLENVRFGSDYFIVWMADHNRWDDRGIIIATKEEYQRVLEEDVDRWTLEDRYDIDVDTDEDREAFGLDLLPDEDEDDDEAEVVLDEEQPAESQTEDVKIDLDKP